jgi:hypothetical protein
MNNGLSTNEKIPIEYRARAHSVIGYQENIICREEGSYIKHGANKNIIIFWRSKLQRAIICKLHEFHNFAFHIAPLSLYTYLEHKPYFLNFVYVWISIFDAIFGTEGYGDAKAVGKPFLYRNIFLANVCASTVVVVLNENEVFGLFWRFFLELNIVPFPGNFDSALIIWFNGCSNKSPQLTGNRINRRRLISGGALK